MSRVSFPNPPATSAARRMRGLTALAPIPRCTGWALPLHAWSMVLAHEGSAVQKDRAGRLSVQIVAEHLGAAGVPQFRHRLGLDLPDPLARHAVDLADLVEGLRLA